MHRLLGPIAAIVVAGCAASTSTTALETPARRPGAAPLADLTSTALAGAIVITGVEYPEPGIIGGHFAGVQFERRTGDILFSEGLRNSWQLSTAMRLDTLLRAAGYRVQLGTLPTSDAVALGATRFGLTARISELRVRTSGTTGPRRSEATLDVAWELLDLAAGAPVYGRRTGGRGQAGDTLQTAVMRAFGQALDSLLSDSVFRRAITRPRPTDFEELGSAAYAPRPDPGSTDTIRLVPSDLNPLPDTSALTRLVAGLVTLRRLDGREESAFLLTRDGLGLTTWRAVQEQRRLWARFGTGVERPVRVLRANRRAGIALIQVSCPDQCVTVPWTLERGSGNAEVVALGPPMGSSASFLVGHGRTRGRTDRIIAPRFDLAVYAELLGGEAVARVQGGRVFALTLYQRRGQRAMTLAETFRLLSIRADSIR